MDVDDLTTLPELSLRIILETIKNRFARNCIFTNVSEIVISVNPFQYLDAVLGDTVIQQFHLSKSQAEISAFPPHLYSLARAAYRGAVGAGPHPAKNQSVLISGESGAGKTEATKLCLRYFASMSATQGASPDEKPQVVVLEEDSLEHKLMNANPILEALGNAKTLRNDNSSRFGKWVSLQLSAKGVIVGGSITKYLLEESRVVTVGSGERNYHIFYQVCKKFGADSSCFRYLSPHCVSNVDDAQDFETVVDALRSIGMAHDERETLFSVVWGILHLGELTFGKAGNDSMLTEASQKALGLAAEVLVGPSRSDGLAKLLLQQVVHAGHETVVTPRTEEQAKTTRDSIAKMLYARLFDYTVFRINGAIELAHISGQQVATSIGILDIFGFESFEVNSFEQLCINYANEKLQLFFIDYLTTAELALYHAEGLDVAKMPHSFTNNQPCVDLLEKPNGVFSLIGDEVRSRTGSDMEFLSKLYREHAKHPCFEKPRVGGKGVFSVRHYAQLVEYTVHNFIDKNKSKVGEDVVAFFTHSQIPMVRAMVMLEVPTSVASPPSANARRVTVRGDPTVARAKFASLGHAFKAQLSDLVVSIEATKAHFIRCIKPNSSCSPQVLDEKMVERQLLTSGMVDAVTIRQLGYSDRLSYPLFLRRYAPLVASYFAPPATKKEWQKVQSASDQDKVRTILQLLPAAVVKHWQLGKSRVFYRQPVLVELEKARELIRHCAARAVQRRLRGAQARRDCREIRLIWQELVTYVSTKQWELVPEALQIAREVGFSPKQLRPWEAEWQAARALRQATSSLVQALSFAAQPALPPNRWFRDRVSTLEQAAEQITARKLRPNESLRQLIGITEALSELLATLWTVCTNQQMDASAGPMKAKEIILLSCRDTTAKRTVLYVKLPELLQQLEASAEESKAVLQWRDTPIDSFPEIQSLCTRIDALDQHFKERVTKVEASVLSTLDRDAKTIESVLGMLTEKELGIPAEYFPNGLQALREPLVKKLSVFKAAQLAQEQAAEEQRMREAAAAEAKAAAARLEPTPLPDHVFKPKLAGNRRKPQQMKSFPPAPAQVGESADKAEDSSVHIGVQDDLSLPVSVVSGQESLPGPPPPLTETTPDDPETPKALHISTSSFTSPSTSSSTSKSSKSSSTSSKSSSTSSKSSSTASTTTSSTSSAFPTTSSNLPGPSATEAPRLRLSPSLLPVFEHSPSTISALLLFEGPSSISIPNAVDVVPAVLATPTAATEISLFRTSSMNSMSEHEGKGETDSDEENPSRTLENPAGFSSLLPVFHGLGTRLNRSSLPGPGTLGIVVHSCANVIFFASNFFVSITYCHPKMTDKGPVPRLKKKRTSVVKKGAKVLTWNEHLEFTARDPATDWVRIAVKEKESRSKSKCLGEVRFRVAEVALMANQLHGNRVGNSQLHRVWQLRGSVQGEITLTFSFIENYWAKEQMKKLEEKRKRRNKKKEDNVDG